MFSKNFVIAFFLIFGVTITVAEKFNIFLEPSTTFREIELKDELGFPRRLKKDDVIDVSSHMGELTTELRMLILNSTCLILNKGCGVGFYLHLKCAKNQIYLNSVSGTTLGKGIYKPCPIQENSFYTISLVVTSGSYEIYINNVFFTNFEFRHRLADAKVLKFIQRIDGLDADESEEQSNVPVCETISNSTDVYIKYNEANGPLIQNINGTITLNKILNCTIPEISEQNILEETTTTEKTVELTEL